MRTPERQQARAYEILVRGELSEVVADELGASRLESRNGRTLVVVEIIDQSHLHGVLERMGDLNIEIESVNPSCPTEAQGHPARAR